jgi:hypothetical protein
MERLIIKAVPLPMKSLKLNIGYNPSGQGPFYIHIIYLLNQEVVIMKKIAKLINRHSLQLD